MALHLVLGGVRSGKSELAERLATAAGAPVCYVATGSAGDPEMAERIARHASRRPAGWRTVETDDPAWVVGAAPAGGVQGRDRGVAGRAPARAGDTVLVDGVAPWLARLMADEGLWTGEEVAALGPGGQAAWARAVDRVRAFAAAAAARPGLTVVAAEESGLGLLPRGAAARRYLDLAGEAAQVLAAAAGRVQLAVAGRPVELGGAAPHRPAGDPVPLPLRLHGDTMVPAGHLDFAVNVVPGGPPPPLRAELARALERAGAYPDEGPATVALADRHGRAPAEVLAANGSVEAFWLLACVLRPGRAVVVHPSFTEPEAALRAAGHRVERAFRHPEDYALDPGAIPGDADLVVVGNPNNPTGTLDPAAALAALARPGRVLVVDEAFMEFCPGEPESLAARAELPGLVVVRSLTKLWGLAGIRAGYLLAPPDLAAALRAARQPWSVNAMACAALAACAADAATPARVAAEVGAARAELAAGLAALPGVRVWPSAANFLLLRVPDGPAARAGLARQGIAVRRADTFPGLTPDHLRVAVRCPEDNRRLVAALAEALR
ncbi:MAG TPA: Rv2231c family pyridoxal phosphate-dependent protein CobC [Actinomycetota bacterium]|nr:Rv2231c family pyridoxal phosphate-dependent protein CobC [Actinomycetota bacterium]